MRKRIVFILAAVMTIMVQNGCKMKQDSRIQEEALVKIQPEETVQTAAAELAADDTDDSDSESQGDVKEESEKWYPPKEADQKTDVKTEAETEEKTEEILIDEAEKPEEQPKEGIDSKPDQDAEQETEKNQNAAVQAGYYQVVPGSDGGYMVLVHGDESEYGFRLLDAYLASLGYESGNGMTGGWVDPQKDQYLCAVSGSSIIPLITEEDEAFWD